MPASDVPPAYEISHIAGEFATSPHTEAKTFFIVRQPRCEEGKAGEIIVCASDPKRNRLEPLPSHSQPDLPKAETRLSENTTIDFQAKNADIAGAQSIRAMASVKIGF